MVERRLQRAQEIASGAGYRGGAEEVQQDVRAFLRRHDFGYRNDGSNTSTPGVHPQFDSDDYRRDTIDKRFLLNMTIQCNKAYPHLYQAVAQGPATPPPRRSTAW